ncbi:hypothetical protein RJ640_014653 [Escallonia rubra]|uniref:polynucleotide adenylyltransferase n=1 Tax=Escallonia rubra TaxID=112253 RepID=A0AA88RV57_9ASTE|nr:hypothetical protein RJ640_014653 [Escallonia rubra]
MVETKTKNRASFLLSNFNRKTNSGSPASVDSTVGSNSSATDPDSGENSGTSATTFYSCPGSPVSPVPALPEISVGSPENLPPATVVPLPDAAGVGSPEVPRLHCATNTCLAAASPPNHGNDICSLTPPLDTHAASFIAPDQLEEVVGEPYPSLGEQWAQYIFGPKSIELNLTIDGPYPSFPPKPSPSSSTRPYIPDPAACPASPGGLALDQYGSNLASSLSQLAVTGQACPHPLASGLLAPSAAHLPESDSHIAQFSPAFVMRIPSETEFQLEDDPPLQTCHTVVAHLRPSLLLLSSTTSVASPESNSSSTSSGKRTRDLDSDLLVISPVVKKIKSGAILQVEAGLFMESANSNPSRATFAPNAQLFNHQALTNQPSPLFPINPSFYGVPVHLALNPGFLVHQMDARRSLSLLQYMVDEGLVPSPEEEIKRKNVIDKLKQIVMLWIKRVAQCQLQKSYVRDAAATILTFGSYGLGVHSSESDIDALCVGPYFATLAEDFFVVLRNMLASRPEISEIICIKDAKVPLMRFKFDGISVDLPYAQLQVEYIPENVDMLNPFFLENIDETSWKSLSGVRVNQSILQLVPNIFQSMLRCIKLWARRRGVYGNLLGFFGGVHLAILVAFVCQSYPNASFNVLVSIFFMTFASWPWPTPVTLRNGLMPRIIPTETRSLMPIQLPCFPREYCHSNITRSTFRRIRAEFCHGHALTKDSWKLDFEWSSLFESFPYSKNYTRFVKICLSASDQDGLGDWVGWVKSRFRRLIVRLEEVQGFCDPNPTEYVDADVARPNIVYYWALQPGRSDFTNVDSVKEEFMKDICNGYQGPAGDMTLSIVQASQLPKSAQSDDGSGKGREACRRVIDGTKEQIPVYLKHLPPYFMQYLATNQNPQYPSAGPVDEAGNVVDPSQKTPVVRGIGIS